MPSSISLHFRLMLAFFALALVGTQPAFALPQFDAPDFGDPFSLDAGGKPLAIEATFESEPGGQKGTVNLKVTLGEGWHVYSVTQKPGGPKISKIILEDSDAFKLTGKFEPDSDPHEKEEGFPVTSEYHEGTVVWSAPVEFAKGTDLNGLEIIGKLTGQRCNDNTGCVPFTSHFTGVYSGEKKKVAATFRSEDSHLLLSGKVIAADPKDKQLDPGDKGFIEITAQPTDGYHIYERKNQGPGPDELGNKPTLIAVSKATGWKIGKIEEGTANAKVAGKKEGDLAKFKKPAKWRIPFTVSKTAETKSYTLAGAMGYQTCTETTCDAPSGNKWQVSIPVGSPLPATGVIVQWKDSIDYAEAAKAVEQGANHKKDAGKFEGKSLWFILPVALLAGFILNFMPCVLPVLGLKLMSFVGQAGENPRRVFLLNAVFVMGILSVFLTLAAMAVFFSLGWGQAFQSTIFQIIMIAVVFAFGISFFGVWEIPIPGFANSDKANELAGKDGYSGQFFKGVLTTLLATPCTGPLLVPTIAWAIAQPPIVTFAVFLTLGLGMATPYLIVGMFPKLIAYLPKPGPWMGVFKHVMGFVMLATAIFLLSAVTADLKTSVLSLLLFIGFGCWLIGRKQYEGTFPQRMKNWGYGIATIALGVVFAFFILLPWYELDYQKFSRLAVDKHLSEGRTVLVDFTADW